MPGFVFSSEGNIDKLAPFSGENSRYHPGRVSMVESQAAVTLGFLGIKPAVQHRILNHYGAFTTYLDSEPGAAPDELAGPLRDYRRRQQEIDDQVRSHLAALDKGGIDLITVTDPHYPPLLREIYRPPLLLYCKGDTGILHLPQLAIVGSRNCSRGGRELAASFASSLAASGFVVTSGLALGVDGAAHQGALQQGTTIAVLGCGVDVVYPRRHRALYDEIVGGGGVVVSEFPPRSKPLPQYFPQRNRIISGLALGVLVIEAAPQSGSLITARQALEQGREVFAVPGSIHNPMARGCHQLIREGAVLTESLDDIVTQLGGLLSHQVEGLEKQAVAALSEDQQSVLNALGYDPMPFDRVAEGVGLDTATLLSLLTSLEIEGLVEQIGGQYQRIR
jgi:DNA processing protein